MVDVAVPSVVTKTSYAEVQKTSYAEVQKTSIRTMSITTIRTMSIDPRAATGTDDPTKEET